MFPRGLSCAAEHQAGDNPGPLARMACPFDPGSNEQTWIWEGTQIAMPIYPPAVATSRLGLGKQNAESVGDVDGNEGALATMMMAMTVLMVMSWLL